MSDTKILIVEDEKDVSELLKDFLVMKGCGDVTAVTKGADALKRIENDKPDIVFLDIMLEDDIDGMKVLKDGMAVSPDTKFVMMSAYKDDYGQKAEELGAYDFLEKPVRLNTIKNMLKKMMK